MSRDPNRNDPVGAGLDTQIARQPTFVALSALAPAFQSVPVISGTLTQGSTLSVTTGGWTNSPTAYVYQWRRGGNAILNATTSSYALTSADVGYRMDCLVTASNTAGSATERAYLTGVVGGSGGGSPTLGTVTLSGALTQGAAASGVSISGATAGSSFAFNIAGISVGTSGSTRSVTGTPATSGALTYTETLAGAVGSPKAGSLGTVAAATGGPILLSIPTAKIGQVYPGFTPSGGTPPYTFAAITGLPAGLTSSSTLGTTGTPTGV